MTEFESLLLVLGAVYLAFCVVWVRRESFVLRALFASEMHCAPANRLLGGEDGALQWLNPLPPFGLVYVVQPLPVSLSEEGVLAWIAAAHPAGTRPRQPEPHFLAWTEVRSAEARERDVIVNGTRFVRTGSVRLAEHLARLLGELARAKPARRTRLLDEELERHMDLVAIGDAAARAERLSAGLVLLQTALFAVVFAATPVVVEFGDIHRQWPWLVLVLVVLQAVLVVRLWTAAGKLVPRERWKHSLQCGLSPLAAMRARDGLTRDALALFAPLAAVKVLCPEGEFGALYRAVLRDLRAPCLPECPLDDERARRTERSWRERLLTAHERLAPKLAAESAAPPERIAGDCLVYCPRCEKQFVKADATCNDCGDRSLVPFAR